MLKEREGAVSRKGRSIKDKNKRILYMNTHSFSSLDKAKDRSPTIMTSAVPQLHEGISLCRGNRLHIKDIFNKVPIIKKKRLRDTPI